MNRQAWPVQGGFTLVEVLIVVVIIAILAGLAVPAISHALAVVEQRAIFLEMNNLTQALEAYRTEYGAYPPDFSDHDAVIAHLDRLFPRRREFINTSGQTAVEALRDYLKTLDATDLVDPISGEGHLNPAQAMVFWLRGFYPNPEYPITGNGVGERQPLLRLPDSMIMTIGERDPTRPARDGDLDTPGEMYAPSRASEAPYVYFDSRSCSGCTKSYEVVAGTVKTFLLANIGIADGGIAVPYMAERTWGTPTPDYVNEDSFQIISAGRDGSFGDFQGPLKWFPSGRNYDTEGFDNDNICNFSSKSLGDAID